MVDVNSPKRVAKDQYCKGGAVLHKRKVGQEQRKLPCDGSPARSRKWLVANSHPLGLVAVVGHKTARGLPSGADALCLLPWGRGSGQYCVLRNKVAESVVEFCVDQR